MNQNNKKYLIDASVAHAMANVGDKHHNVCKEFFEKHQNDTMAFPVHAYFELHASIAKRKKGGSFLPFPGNVSISITTLSLTAPFYDECKKRNLFQLFDLRGSDLIYACIAKIENCTLVTCDSDFDKCIQEINVLKLIP